MICSGERRDDGLGDIPNCSECRCNGFIWNQFEGFICKEVGISSGNGAVVRTGRTPRNEGACQTGLGRVLTAEGNSGPSETATGETGIGDRAKSGTHAQLRVDCGKDQELHLPRGEARVVDEEEEPLIVLLKLDLKTDQNEREYLETEQKRRENIDPLN